HDLDDEERRQAYNSDVTYGTNNEFGFDYLRDNMKFDLADCVQRVHHYGIVDEVDSILIDEARTPLIISGSSEESTEKYYKIDKIIPSLKEGDDYDIDEKHRQASIKEPGVEKEATEFEKIYILELVVIPTNRALIRHEFPDVVYRMEREKFNAVIEEIKEYHLRGQPVLVGTIAIEKSEKLSAQSRKSGFLPG